MSFWSNNKDSIYSGVGTVGKFTYKGVNAVGSVGATAFKSQREASKKKKQHIGDFYGEVRDIKTISDPTLLPPPPLKPGQLQYTSEKRRHQVQAQGTQFTASQPQIQAQQFQQPQTQFVQQAASPLPQLEHQRESQVQQMQFQQAQYEQVPIAETVQTAPLLSYKQSHPSVQHSSSNFDVSTSQVMVNGQTVITPCQSISTDHAKNLTSTLFTGFKSEQAQQQTQTANQDQAISQIPVTFGSQTINLPLHQAATFSTAIAVPLQPTQVAPQPETQPASQEISYTNPYHQAPPPPARDYVRGLVSPPSESVLSLGFSNLPVPANATPQQLPLINTSTSPKQPPSAQPQLPNRQLISQKISKIQPQLPSQSSTPIPNQERDKGAVDKDITGEYIPPEKPNFAPPPKHKHYNKSRDEIYAEKEVLAKSRFSSYSPSSKCSNAYPPSIHFIEGSRVPKTSTPAVGLDPKTASFPVPPKPSNITSEGLQAGRSLAPSVPTPPLRNSTSSTVSASSFAAPPKPTNPQAPKGGFTPPPRPTNLNVARDTPPTYEASGKRAIPGLPPPNLLSSFPPPVRPSQIHANQQTKAENAKSANLLIPSSRPLASSPTNLTQVFVSFNDEGDSLVSTFAPPRKPHRKPENEAKEITKLELKSKPPVVKLNPEIPARVSSPEPKEEEAKPVVLPQLDLKVFAPPFTLHKKLYVEEKKIKPVVNQKPKILTHSESPAPAIAPRPQFGLKKNGSSPNSLKISEENKVKPCPSALETKPEIKEKPSPLPVKAKPPPPPLKPKPSFFTESSQPALKPKPDFVKVTPLPLQPKPTITINLPNGIKPEIKPRSGLTKVEKATTAKTKLESFAKNPASHLKPTLSSIKKESSDKPVIFEPIPPQVKSRAKTSSMITLEKPDIKPILPKPSMKTPLHKFDTRVLDQNENIFETYLSSAVPKQDDRLH